VKLHCETWGRGRRLVFVHGFTQTGRSWRPIAERNGIDDPMRLPAGTSLLIPAAEELGG